MKLDHWHPYAEKFPMLEGEERESFVESVRSTGGNEQPIEFRIVDGKKEGIDGRNRLSACEAGKVKPVFKLVKLADADVKAYIIRRNITRRHLTKELRQALVADLREDGGSIRVIAETLGVSHATVHRDLAGVTNDTPDPGETFQKSGKIFGSDGKEYLATKPPIRETLCPSCETKDRKGQSLPRACAECRAIREPKKPAQPVPAPPEKLLDKEGIEYPEQALPAVRFVSRIREFTGLIDDCIAMAEQIAKEPIGLYVDRLGITDRLGVCKALMSSSKPVHVCGYCLGKNPACKGCKGKGWQTKGGYANSPKGKDI